jgi:glycosyltransferase involved in cell wall biosynthesis
MNGSVLIIVENLPVPFDRRVWMEATTLVASGYRVSVICPMGKGYESPFEQIDGVAIYRHPLPPERSSMIGYVREYATALLHEWRLARKIYKTNRFDVIHACNPPDLLCIVAWWFKALHGTRFLFDHHDLAPELYESKFNRHDLFHWALLRAERLTFLTADIVISTNESYRAIALSRGGKHPSQTFVVRSGPNLSLFSPVPPVAAYKKGKRFMVGYLGVMGEFDGVDHFVRAAEHIVKHHARNDIHFCLIGSGPMLDTLKKLTGDLRLDTFIEFTGRVPDREMIDRLSTCDVCVDCDPLNSLNDKSTMNKILEYMALGKPVVQYDLVEGRRSAGDAAIYARPNDTADLALKILTLLDDEELRRRMGVIARARMENEFEWRHQAPRLLNAYEALFKSGNDLPDWQPPL